MFWGGFSLLLTIKICVIFLIKTRQLIRKFQIAIQLPQASSNSQRAPDRSGKTGFWWPLSPRARTLICWWRRRAWLPDQVWSPPSCIPSQNGPWYRKHINIAIVLLAKQERWLLPGTWSHLCFAGVRECLQWCSIVDATVTVHQFFCILHYIHVNKFYFLIWRFLHKNKTIGKS